MKKKIIIISILSVFVAGLFFLTSNLPGEEEENIGTLDIPADMKKVTLYKDPNCGCCEGHAQMYRNAGFDVEVITNQDLNQIKTENGITPDIASCHTAMIGDYVVEGHVPLEGIKMLINEMPDTTGISLPGMPVGTPGMPGMKIGTYKIRNIDTKEIILEI